MCVFMYQGLQKIKDLHGWVMARCLSKVASQGEGVEDLGILGSEVPGNPSRLYQARFEGW